jgi:hypothetical protein
MWTPLGEPGVSGTSVHHVEHRQWAEKGWWQYLSPGFTLDSESISWKSTSGG